MARTAAEWTGKSDDTPIPPRVRLRQFNLDGGICQCGCGTKIAPGDNWQTDHKIAIVNGGVNAERNLRTILAEHHKLKTVADVAEKAAVAKRAKAHLGIKGNHETKLRGRTREEKHEARAARSAGRIPLPPRRMLPGFVPASGE